MNLKEEIQPLLDQYTRFNGRGNIISANLVLSNIIDKLVAAIQDNSNKPASDAIDDTHVDSYIEPEELITPPKPAGRPRGRPRKTPL